MILRSCLLLLVACSVTQTGNPQLDPSGVTVTACSNGCISAQYDVVGPPGSVDPPDGLVRFFDLQGVAPPLEAPVLPDGSFSLAGVMGTLFHVDVAQGDARSDALLLSLADPRPEVLAAPSCVSLEPSGPVRVDGSVAVVVSNGCPSATNVGLRGASDGFSLEGGGLLVAGDSTITVRAEAGARDELLLIAVGDEVHTTTLFTR